MRKFKDGSHSYTTTMAMYEDGTLSECDSCWAWEDIEGKYDEEKRLLYSARRNDGKVHVREIKDGDIGRTIEKF